MLAIARALVVRGHRVNFAAPERFRTMVELSGMSFHALRPDPQLTDDNPLARGVPVEKRDTKFALCKLVFPFVRDTFEDMLSVAKSADLLCFPLYMYPGPIAAERLGIPWVVLHFAPGTFNSRFDPPLFPPLAILHGWQRRSPRIAQAVTALASLAIRSWSAPLQKLQAQENFAGDRREPLLHPLRSPWLTLALFPSELGAPQPDWPVPSLNAGFPFYEERPAEADSLLQRFLQSGEAPVVATLGAAAGLGRKPIFTKIISAVARLGRRLLLIAGEDANELTAWNSPTVFVTEYAPYSEVFPHACVLLLSGSVGPLSHGMRHGIPMLLIPTEHAADQPDNALRLQRLGVSRTLPERAFSVDRAVQELQELLANSSYREAARRYADRLRDENGVTTACKALETVLN